MKPSETLAEAQRIMRTQGHGKGAFYNEDTGNVCLAGALMMACGQRWNDELEILDYPENHGIGFSLVDDREDTRLSAARNFLSRAIRTYSTYSHIWDFNDADEISQEDALIMLKHAEALAKESE